MSLRDSKLLILDMMDSLERALSYVEGMSHDEFLTDQKTKDAVVRNIQIIGEAAYRVPKETQDISPEIDWMRISKSRHVLVHDYFATDYEIIWTILQVHLPELYGQLQELSKKL